MEKTSRARARITKMASLGRMVVPDMRMLRGENSVAIAISCVAFLARRAASSEPINSSDCKEKKSQNTSLWDGWMIKKVVFWSSGKYGFYWFSAGKCGTLSKMSLYSVILVKDFFIIWSRKKRYLLGPAWLLLHQGITCQVVTNLAISTRFSLSSLLGLLSVPRIYYCSYYRRKSNCLFKIEGFTAFCRW